MYSKLEKGCDKLTTGYPRSASETLQCPLSRSYLIGHYVPRPKLRFAHGMSHHLAFLSESIVPTMYILWGILTTYHRAFYLLMIGHTFFFRWGIYVIKNGSFLYQPMGPTMYIPSGILCAYDGAYLFL